MALYSVCSAVVAFWSIGSDLMVLCSAMASCSACSGFLLCYGFLPWLLCYGFLPCLLHHGFLHYRLCYGFLPCQIRHGPMLHYSTVRLCSMAQVLQWATACYCSMAQVLHCAKVCHCTTAQVPYWSMVQVLNCASVCHCSMVQVLYPFLGLPHGPGPPSLPLFCLCSTSLLDLCLMLCYVWKPLLKGGGLWLCPAGVPTSSSSGHSIQNLYHCLTKSISQYTPCLISYTAGFNQEDYLRHHTLHCKVLFQC